ncbi:MAG: 2-oxoacid:acceptor oxidoreductase family protein [Paeniclostridium sp.]
MLNEIICAGLGVRSFNSRKNINYVAYKANKQLTWFPSYGNEMRGGSANCNVVISDEKIASPVVKILIFY